MPEVNKISKWEIGKASEEVCPWNVKFAQELPEGSPFATRAMCVDKDARTLAQGILTMTPTDYAAAFNGSAMKRAKWSGLVRNASFVLGNLGEAGNEEPLISSLRAKEPLVRTHAALAVRSIRTEKAFAAARAHVRVEVDEAVRVERLSAIARKFRQTLV